VRVTSRQSPSPGGIGGVVGRSGQHGTKGRLASDESGGDAAARKVRTVVYDDDYEEWNKASRASKRRNNTTAEPRTSQVSGHSYTCIYTSLHGRKNTSPSMEKAKMLIFLSEKNSHRPLVTFHKTQV